MTARIEVLVGDDPDLRRILMRELAPMLTPRASAPPRWISVTVSTDGEPRGGLIGLVTGAWLSIDLLWLPESLRGDGIGHRLLSEAESRAADLGCLGAYVGTTAQSARSFYVHNGYIPKLELPEVYDGVTQTVLQKFFRNNPVGTTAQPMSRT